jgi:hypothetical protein
MRGNGVTPPSQAGLVPFAQALLLQADSETPAFRPPCRVRQWNTSNGLICSISVLHPRK